MSETTYTLQSTADPNLFRVNAQAACGMPFDGVATVHEMMKSKNPIIEFHGPLGLRGVEKIAALVREYRERYE